MPEPKEQARIADEKEEKRISKLQKEYFSTHKSIHYADIFDSEEIPKILKEKPASFNNSLKEAFNSMPLNSILYSRIVVQICPYCIRDPAVIKPYLERDIILPILTARLYNYKSDVIEEIIRHPYINIHSFNLYRQLQACDRCTTEARANPCPQQFVNEFLKPCESIVEKLNTSVKSKKNLEKYNNKLLKVAFPVLYPDYEAERHILRQIDEVISQKKFHLIEPLTTKACTLSALRLSKAFNAVPEIAQEDIAEINNISQKLAIPFNETMTNIVDDKKWTAEALGITFNPKMPIEEYLDIVIPRKKKINSLLDNFISEKDSNLQKSINDEIWKINRELDSSKKVELLNYFTSFPLNNLALISELLIGGLVGYTSASFLGCGAEGIAGTTGIGSFGTSLASVAAKRTGLTKKLNFPKPPKKTIEWIKGKAETQEEKLLATMLAKDLPVIQVWSLRKKLMYN